MTTHHGARRHRSRRISGIVAAIAAAGTLALAGCGEETAEPGGGPGDATDPAGGEPPAAGGDADPAEAEARSLGGPDSACPLPVTFTLAENWEPEPFDATAHEPDRFTHRAGVGALACEIDAKPAGSIGFIRAWAGDATGGDAMDVVRAFIAAELHPVDPEYRQVTAGDFADAAEVTYEAGNSLDDETKRERALAVVTDDAVALLHLGGLDSEEHDEMLPAFELAKETLSAS